MPGVVRTFHHRQADPSRLVAAKAGRTVSVCIPARDEAETVGAVVAGVRALTAAGGGPALVDEVVVVDDGSTDATAERAVAAGAAVVPGLPGGRGKGAAMRRGLEHASGELVVFLDADVGDFGPHYVTGLLLPLLRADDVALVKGCYERPLDGRPGEGGRVTELVAKPLLSLLHPELAEVRQPLAGETAAPRAVLDKIALADGYGVEMALLLDVADQFGPGSVAQVDLGIRTHRNRPLAELRPQATEVLRAALERAGTLPAPPRAR